MLWILSMIGNLSKLGDSTNLSMDEDPASKSYKLIEKSIDLFSTGVITIEKYAPQEGYPSAPKRRD
jgi:hypothetical protein